MAVPQHMVVGGAGVKPDIKYVGAFEVVGGVCANNGFGAGIAPSLNPAGFHHACCLVHDFHRAWVQLAGSGVDEKWQWHAPVTLAANAPIGPAGNHAV